MSDTFAMVEMQIFFSFLRFFFFLMHASIFLQHVKIFLCIKKEKNRHKETEKPFPASPALELSTDALIARSRQR